jgi:RNA polymerase sigma-70 factor (ECF subfamily)
VTDHERSDRLLLSGLAEQPELIGVLYERHAPAVFRFLSRRAGPVAAEDLLSEVFAAALQSRGRVVAHDSGSALPWLYGIAGTCYGTISATPGPGAPPPTMPEWTGMPLRHGSTPRPGAANCAPR